MKFTLITLTMFLICGNAAQNNPVKQIIGNGFQRHYKMYVSDSTNRHDKQTWYFYANVLPTDSLTVIGHEVYKEHEAYAFIIHNKNSESHQTFSKPYIKEWRNNREIYNADTSTDRHINENLLEKFDGFWVFVEKYQGEFYLHQDWACLMARELTDSTWVQIDMEITAYGIKNLHGTVKDFTIERTKGDRINFRLVEPEREIYRVNEHSYMIPVRRIHDFELIAYCNIADLQDPFVKFDE